MPPLHSGKASIRPRRADWLGKQSLAFAEATFAFSTLFARSRARFLVGRSALGAILPEFIRGPEEACGQGARYRQVLSSLSFGQGGRRESGLPQVGGIVRGTPSTMGLNWVSTGFNIGSQPGFNHTLNRFIFRRRPRNNIAHGRACPQRKNRGNRTRKFLAWRSKCNKKGVYKALICRCYIPCYSVWNVNVS